MTEAADELEAIRQVEATATGIWAMEDLLTFPDQGPASDPNRAEDEGW